MISLNTGNEIIKNISHISETTGFRPNTIYIGRFSSVEYRFHSMSGITLFLINDSNPPMEKERYGNNCVVLFPKETEQEELLEQCKEYIRIQEDVMDSSQKLLDLYLSDGSLQTILDAAADIIQNPLMVLDNGYRVICYSDNGSCDDLQWRESIQNGYCSYEFVSHFNQLSEIRSTKKEDGPFFAGCLMSPIRRCIAKMYVDKKQIGYLLSIESSGPFSEGVIQILEVVSRMLSKLLAFSALESGRDIYHSVWNYLINAIEEVPGSVNRLKEYLKRMGVGKQPQYYLILVNQKQCGIEDSKMDWLSDLIRKVFPVCVFGYYDRGVLVLINSQEDCSRIKSCLLESAAGFSEKNLNVLLSDPFTELSEIAKYYRQVKRTEILAQKLRENEVACSYDEIRRYDMLLTDPVSERGFLYIRKKEQELYEYDKMNGTEYFKTLYSYIKNSRSLQDVADELHIHKNTVSYRVNRVREMLGLNLNDAETRIGLYLAYLTYELQEKGLLPERTEET